jgi:hypothetical protein
MKYSTLAELQWQQSAVIDGAAVEAKLQRVSKVMSFALVLLARSKPELIDVVEGMVDEGGLRALRDLNQELDTGAVELDELLELVNTARFRCSSAVANLYPDGIAEAGRAA